MKKQHVIELFAVLCLSLATASALSQNATINIMPMGDSVTSRGNTPESSYRYWLYTYLTHAHFSNTLFVGNQGGVSDGTPANSWPQEAYEGGDGWTTSEGVGDASNAAGILNSGNPGATILLLDLGANDIFAGESQSLPLKTNLVQMQQNLETIIQTFAQDNSSTVVLLAVPTPWVINPPDPEQKKFITEMGSFVTKAAQAERKLGVHVIVVNLRSGFNPRIGADTTDGTHPDIKGEQMIAKKFFNALRPVLKKMEKEGL